MLLTVSTEDGMLVGDLQTNLVSVERYRHDFSDDSVELMDCDDVQDVSSEGFWDELSVALASGAGNDGVLFEEGRAAGLPPQLFEEASSTESSSWITMPLPSDSLLDALIWSNLRGDAPAAASRQTAQAMPAMHSASWLLSGVDAGGSDVERLSGFAVLATAWLFIVRALRLVAALRTMLVALCPDARALLRACCSAACSMPGSSGRWTRLLRRARRAMRRRARHHQDVELTSLRTTSRCPCLLD